jgi:hypothetical protein
MGINQTAKEVVKRGLYQLYNHRYQPRYYFVGLTATGNRTAGKAMSLLGYSWSHCPLSIPSLWHSQVATDTPIALWFRQGKLPKTGIYVLTTRALDPWLDDCQAWFESKPMSVLSPIEKEVRAYLYEGITFDRDRFARAYDRHTTACREMATTLGITLHEWDVNAHPNWNLLSELTGRSSSEPFPFTPGVYHKTWQAVEEAQKAKGSYFI